jgi:uncharacterized membrane protein YphA (DoxX/SURF4 family)
MAKGKGGSADFGLLVLRLALGGIFIAHGVGTLIGGGPEALGQQLQLGLAPPAAIGTGLLVAEIGGGLLVVLGILPRLGAIALAIVAAVMLFKLYVPGGFSLALEATLADFNGWPGPKDTKLMPLGLQYVSLLAMSLAVLFAGGGALSLLAGGRKRGDG